MKEFERLPGGKVINQDVYDPTAHEVARRYRIEPYKDGAYIGGGVTRPVMEAEIKKPFEVDQSIIDDVNTIYCALGAKETAECIIKALRDPDTTPEVRKHLEDHVTLLKGETLVEDALSRLIRDIGNSNGNGNHR